ncbi:ABC transporter ATP-binding protein [Planctomicrobium sp. SH664]|uniref:ABC transporter ATP-binding protein n=1 Tax=Planctomicrobium sp. SH664 TaxID=3448125 RepID=UPI003F5C9898
MTSQGTTPRASTATPSQTGSSAGPLAVRCTHVTKEFGDGKEKLLALKDVSIQVEAGQMTLLVGPSGCGKTTLLSIISGLLPPTGGDVELFGTNLLSLSGSAKVQFRGKNIGFVFQQHNLLSSLTAAENVAVPLTLAGVSRRKALAAANEYLAKVGLARRGNSLPDVMSGGERQRVAVARALVHEPRLLMCDEPTASLDAHSGHVVMELLRNVAVETGRAVIVVTHDSRIFHYADAMIQMDDGRVVRAEKGYFDAHAPHVEAAPHFESTGEP